MSFNFLPAAEHLDPFSQGDEAVEVQKLNKLPETVLQEYIDNVSNAGNILIRLPYSQKSSYRHWITCRTCANLPSATCGLQGLPYREKCVHASITLTYYTKIPLFRKGDGGPAISMRCRSPLTLFPGSLLKLFNACRQRGHFPVELFNIIPRRDIHLFKHLADNL